MPKGHLPVVSYLAVPVVSRSGEVHGGLFFGHDEAGVFTKDAEDVVLALATHAAIAIDNARLLQSAQAEVEQRRAAEIDRLLLGSIVTSSADAIVSKDLNGIIVSWNHGAQRLFGYSAEEVIGRPITILIPEGHLDEEPKILERIRRGERVEHYETVRRRKDGQLLAISLSVSPVKDEEGPHHRCIQDYARHHREQTRRSTVEAGHERAGGSLPIHGQAASRADLWRGLQCGPGRDRSGFELRACIDSSL